jgi:prepilin-type N-terminal cleavage/methylation domain-containing protein/prepilin-type processing-associated H-X9-DG protein
MITVQFLPRARPPVASSRSSGFTLIELLVVIAIIAILAALAFPLVSRMIAAGHKGKATANLRQIAALMASYTADNNNCLPILIDNWDMGSSPDNFRFWQNLLRLQAGMKERKVANIHKEPWLPDVFYDPAVKKQRHPWGDFGGNDSIMLGLGQSPQEKDCLHEFGQTRGTPLSSIGRLSKKVIVTSAMDQPGSSWGSSWYFQGDRFASGGSASPMPKPDARHGGKALCLFADGHTEALDTTKMSAAERREYFLRDGK